MGGLSYRGALGIAATVLAISCADDNSNPFDAAEGGSSEADGGPATASAADDAGQTGTGTDTGAGETAAIDDTGEPPKLDLAVPDLGGGEQGCTMATPADVHDGTVTDCTDQAPPDSFDPVVQWTWEGGESYHTPLVINLTDDNGNGEIDVCDTPDVLVLTGVAGGTLHVLDGQTGAEHFSIGGLEPQTTPAVGDIDGDGLPEIVAGAGIPFAASLVAFEHDGTPKWTSSVGYIPNTATAVGIANFDNVGPAEVYVGNILVRGDNGQSIFAAPAQIGLLGDTITAPTAADLDGDDDLELIRGQDAWHHDGTVYYQNDTVTPGFSQIANLDDDLQPEVLVINTDGITLLEHDGTPIYQNVRPSGDPAGFSWYRPAAVHDFDGDGEPEYAVSSASHYAAYHKDYQVMWIADVQDPSGVAAGTAFDFLGDGSAEAMFADEYHLFAFDVVGTPLMEVDRSSGTLIEYPVVADVDNDGAAEVLVVSNKNFDGEQLSATLQVIRDADDRWIQARRIWNQHTYHVTNVNEDGTIPDVEPRSWELLNTYRTNAQIEGGSVCVPPAG